LPIFPAGGRADLSIPVAYQADIDQLKLIETVALDIDKDQWQEQILETPQVGTRI